MPKTVWFYGMVRKLRTLEPLRAMLALAAQAQGASMQKQIENFGDYPVEFDCDPEVPPQYMSRPVEMVGACNGVKYGEKLQSIVLMHRRAFREQCQRGASQEEEISKLLFSVREQARKNGSPVRIWLDKFICGGIFFLFVLIAIALCFLF